MPDTGTAVVESPVKGNRRRRWRTLQNRIERARDLRRGVNHAEQAIWELLCTHPLGGLRFRRMHPIGPFLAVFACVARKLVIEVDGDDDPRRTQLMEQLGWRVARFSAKDVLDDPQETWREIDRLLNGPYNGSPAPTTVETEF